MMDAIRFLEHAGREPMSTDDYASAVAGLEVSDLQRQALLDCNHAALVELLDARPTMFFGIFAPDEEAPMEDEPVEDEPGEPLDPEGQI